MKNSIFILSLALFTLLASCSKSPKCWGKDKNEGEIVRYQHAHSCFDSLLVITDFIEIRSATEPDSLTSCTATGLDIDFNKYSLIGQATNAHSLQKSSGM